MREQRFVDGKYAVLLALMDLCLERTQASGTPPDVVSTLELAEKIVEIYWPHTAPFGARAREARVLRQNTSGQAEIVSAITRFRARHAPEAATSWQGRLDAPKEYEALVRSVEWKLIEMPLPRLQRMGAASEEFLYQIGWNESIAKRTVDRYVEGDTEAFDNRVYLKPGVGEYLLQLNGLLRPLIHRRWCAMVALLNKLEDSNGRPSSWRRIGTVARARIVSSASAVTGPAWAWSVQVSRHSRTEARTMRCHSAASEDLGITFARSSSAPWATKAPYTGS